MNSGKKRTNKSAKVVFGSFEMLDEAIEKAVRLHVNGKIDKLNERTESMNDKLDELKESHEAHKTALEPVLASFNDTVSFKKVVANYAKIIVGLVAFIGAVIFLIDFARGVLVPDPPQNMTPVPTNQQ